MTYSLSNININSQFTINRLPYSLVPFFQYQTLAKTKNSQIWLLRIFAVLGLGFAVILRIFAVILMIFAVFLMIFAVKKLIAVIFMVIAVILLTLNSQSVHF